MVSLSTKVCPIPSCNGLVFTPVMQLWCSIERICAHSLVDEIMCSRLVSHFKTRLLRPVPLLLLTSDK